MTAPFPHLSPAFANAFGDYPSLIARAPGRVNLIGEHTDYNDGFVLPAAIGVETQVAARRRADRVLRIVAVDFDGAESRWEIDAPYAPDPAQPWANYARGMVAAMRAAGHAIPGADLAVSGTIPKGSGLSSSASLTVAVGTALSALGALDLDGTALARLAQASETEYVGMPCGIMDQLISARGVAGHALLIDCRSLEAQPVALPEGVAVMIVHSGITRGLVEGHYAARRTACEQAAAALGVPALRDATLAMLEEARAKLDPVTLARARHVITENARTLAAAQALRSGNLPRLGALMAQSHASMRDDFAITTPRIDALVAELQGLISGEGGARMTGGGFGGAVVAVMQQARAAQVAAAITYRTPEGQPPAILIETACAGAGLL